MQYVVVDTNIFLLPFQFRLDILSEFERLFSGPFLIVVSTQAVSELKHLQTKQPQSKNAIAARLGYSFFEKATKQGKIKIVRSREPVDGWLIGWAEKNRAVVCTNDAAVRKKAKEKGLQVVSLRNKSSLAFV